MSDAHVRKRLRWSAGWWLSVLAMASACSNEFPDATADGIGEQSAAISNVTAGARVVPDVSWVRNAPSSCTHYIAATGNDANAGTSAAPWKTIGKAVNALRAGNVGCVQPGTYVENIDFAARAAASGTSTAPIVLKAATSTKPIVQSGANAPVFRINRGSYWILDGLDIDMNGQNHRTVFIDQRSFIAIRRSIIRGSDGVTNATGGIVIYATQTGPVTDIYIAENDIHNHRRAYSNGVRDDSFGIFIFPNVSKVLAARNRMWDNSADGMQCQSAAESGVPGVDPSDLTFEDNRIFTTAAFQRKTEEAYDIKGCQYVTIRGVPRSRTASDGYPGTDSSKIYGFRHAENSSALCSGTCATNTSRGGGIVAHFGARNVLVEYTRIWDVCEGVGFSSTNTAVFRHNAVFDVVRISDGSSRCEGYGVKVLGGTGGTGSSTVRLHNNTLDGIANVGFRVGYDNPSYGSATYENDVDVWNNIVRDTPTWLQLRTAHVRSFESDYNLFWNSNGNQTGIQVDGTARTLPQWQAGSWTNVILDDPNSTVGDPLFPAGVPSTADYCTAVGSPARDSGSSIDGYSMPVCGARRDRGFLESDCATCPP